MPLTPVYRHKRMPNENFKRALEELDLRRGPNDRFWCKITGMDDRQYQRVIAGDEPVPRWCPAMLALLWVFRGQGACRVAEIAVEDYVTEAEPRT